MRTALSILLPLLLLLPLLTPALSQPTSPNPPPSTTSPAPTASLATLPSLSPPPQLAPLFPALRPFTSPSPSNLSLPLHRYIIVLRPSISPTNLTSLLTSILPPNTSVHQLFIGPPSPSPSLHPSPSPSPSPLTPPTSSHQPPPFNAFSAFLTPSQVSQVRASPYVEYVEEDGLVSLEYDLTGMRVVGLEEERGEEGEGGEEIEQVRGGGRARSPYYSWGLDRIDERQLPLTGQYSPTLGSHGEGVTVYLIDTGCRTTHRELTPRAKVVYTLFPDVEDTHGHGTHTAGTVGGLHVGVANQVSLACLAVLDASGTGTYSDVIGAMLWVQAHAVAPAIMSMSLGGSFSQAINDQTAVLMAHGLTCVSASGNSGSASTCSADASGVSPASTPGLIVAASSNESDAFSSFDDYGPCVTVAAPGERILSSWGSGDDTYAIASGTSMACPHVAGVAALYLAGHRDAAHEEVKASIQCSATVDALSNTLDDTPNLLLYAEVTPCNTTPTPSATSSLDTQPPASTTTSSTQTPSSLSPSTDTPSSASTGGASRPLPALPSSPLPLSPHRLELPEDAQAGESTGSSVEAVAAERPSSEGGGGASGGDGGGSNGGAAARSPSACAVALLLLAFASA